jgi:alpha-glucosidase
MKIDPNYQLHLVFPLTTGANALRYYFPETPRGLLPIVAENTCFTFPPDTSACFTQWAQGRTDAAASQLARRGRTTPLARTGRVSMPVCHAAKVDYARTNFNCIRDAPPYTVVTSLTACVDTITPSPLRGRVTWVAETPGQLLENNDILLNLNDPCAIEDTS